MITFLFKLFLFNANKSDGLQLQETTVCLFGIILIGAAPFIPNSLHFLAIAGWFTFELGLGLLAFMAYRNADRFIRSGHLVMSGQNLYCALQKVRITSLFLFIGMCSIAITKRYLCFLIEEFA